MAKNPFFLDDRVFFDPLRFDVFLLLDPPFERLDELELLLEHVLEPELVVEPELVLELVLLLDFAIIYNI